MLILLSGLLCDDTIWSDVRARLSPRIEVSIRNFPNFDSISAMADHVLMDAPATFELAGHSMGGRVALEIVRKAPSRVRGLGLFNTGVHPRREHEWDSRGKLVHLARTSGMAAVACEWLPPMMGASPARVAELMPTLTRMVERNSPLSFAAQTKALLERPDADSVLPLIDVPTLLVSGTADKWSPVAQHVDMQRRIQNARLVTIEDAGHMAPVEQPDAVVAAIDSWLARL